GFIQRQLRCLLPYCDARVLSSHARRRWLAVASPFASMPSVEHLAHRALLPLRTQQTLHHQQQHPSAGEAEQCHDEPQQQVPPADGLHTRRMDEVGLASERASHVLTQRVGVLGNVTTEILAQRVELLRKTLFHGVQRGLQVAPRRLLRPEGEDTQERGGQDGLVLLREPGVAELLHGHRRLHRDGWMISLAVLWGDHVPTDWRSLNGFSHRICLTEKRVLMPCLCSRPLPAPHGPVCPSPVRVDREGAEAKQHEKGMLM